MKIIAFALCVTFAVILAGCGGEDKKNRTPAQTVDRLWDGVVVEDYKKACSVMSEKGKKDLIRGLELEGKKTCENAWKENRAFMVRLTDDKKFWESFTLKVKKTTIKGNKATVKYVQNYPGDAEGISEQKGTAKLVKVDGEWLYDKDE